MANLTTITVPEAKAARNTITLIIPSEWVVQISMLAKGKSNSKPFKVVMQQFGIGLWRALLKGVSELAQDAAAGIPESDPKCIQKREERWASRIKQLHDGTYRDRGKTTSGGRLTLLGEIRAYIRSTIAVHPGVSKRLDKIPAKERFEKTKSLEECRQWFIKYVPNRKGAELYNITFDRIKKEQAKSERSGAAELEKLLSETQSTTKKAPAKAEPVESAMDAEEGNADTEKDLG